MASTTSAVRHSHSIIIRTLTLSRCHSSASTAKLWTSKKRTWATLSSHRRTTCTCGKDLYLDPRAACTKEDLLTLILFLRRIIRVLTFVRIQLFSYRQLGSLHRELYSRQGASDGLSSRAVLSLDRIYHMNVSDATPRSLRRVHVVCRFQIKGIYASTFSRTIGRLRYPSSK